MEGHDKFKHIINNYIDDGYGSRRGSNDGVGAGALGIGGLGIGILFLILILVLFKDGFGRGHGHGGGDAVVIANDDRNFKESIAAIYANRTISSAESGQLRDLQGKVIETVITEGRTSLQEILNNQSRMERQLEKQIDCGYNNLKDALFAINTNFNTQFCAMSNTMTHQHNAEMRNIDDTRSELGRKIDHLECTTLRKFEETDCLIKRESAFTNAHITNEFKNEEINRLKCENAAFKTLANDEVIVRKTVDAISTKWGEPAASLRADCVDEDRHHRGRGRFDGSFNGVGNGAFNETLSNNNIAIGSIVGTQVAQNIAPLTTAITSLVDTIKARDVKSEQENAVSKALAAQAMMFQKQGATA